MRRSSVRVTTASAFDGVRNSRPEKGIGRRDVDHEAPHGAIGLRMADRWQRDNAHALLRLQRRLPLHRATDQGTLDVFTKVWKRGCQSGGRGVAQQLGQPSDPVERSRTKRAQLACRPYFEELACDRKVVGHLSKGWFGRLLEKVARVSALTDGLEARKRCRVACFEAYERPPGGRQETRITCGSSR
jgi:hypothetical protein